jgi:hypothetical protein
MNMSESLKWLAVRRLFAGGGANAGGGAGAGRPCLPAVELLGDRVLFSLSTGGEGGGDVAVLIGLMRQTQPVLAEELAALKIASDASAAGSKFKVDFFKLSREFLKVDQLLFKFGEALIKLDEVDASKVSKLEQKVMTAIGGEFLKIDALVARSGWGGEVGGALLPAVQRVEEAALAAAKGLAGLAGPGGDLGNKGEAELLKISDTFLKIDANLLKLATAVFAGDVIGNKQEAFIKLESKLLTLGWNKLDALVSKIGDAEFKQEIDGFGQATMDIAAGLLKPTEIFDGGPVVIGDTDDVIR